LANFFFKARTVSSYFLPLYLMLSTALAWLARPLAAAASAIRLWLAAPTGFSTPVSFTPKPEAEVDGAAAAAGKEGAGFLDFMTSTAKKEPGPTATFSAFSSDGEN
jgi:hypothetical protein